MPVLFHTARQRRGASSLDHQQLIARGSLVAAQFRQASSGSIQRIVDTLRETIVRDKTCLTAEILEVGCGLVCTAVERVLGKQLFETQLQAGLALLQGRIAEMATGEGKTLSIVLPAVLQALSGRGVHVASANSYLAERDQQLLAPVYEFLGLSCGLSSPTGSFSTKQQAYDCDITYATASEFGFDYLRDQLANSNDSPRPLGERFLKALAETSAPRRKLQRGLNCVIVDEADNVLLDDATSPLLLSSASPGPAPDAALYQRAIQVARQLEPQRHFAIDPATRELWLLPEGEELVQQRCDLQLLSKLQRPWSRYVMQSLRVLHLLQRNVHYVVRDNRVQIVDESTGRIFADRHWRDGLQQAAAACEGLPILEEQRGLAQISRQRLYRLYRQLSGLTGTATGSEAEFRQIYRLSVQPIPTRLPCRRRLLPTHYYPTRADKYRAIVAAVAQRHATGQPILIGTRTIADSLHLAAALADLQLACQVLNGLQDAAEADLIAQAGEPGAITIATNMAGRGTDIRPSKAALERGGLHVVASERNLLTRIDRQLIGRSARQGEPGSAQFFVSADDELLSHWSPRLGARLRRISPQGEISATCDTAVQHLQQRIDRTLAARRAALLQRDLDSESWLASLAGTEP